MTDNTAERSTLTIVLNINDREALERDFPGLKALAISEYDPAAPYSVAGLSTGNEIQRSTMIEKVLNFKEDHKIDAEDALSMIGDILNLFEPAEFDAFDWEGLDDEDDKS